CIAGRAGVARMIAVDAEPISVAPQSSHAAQPWGPGDRVEVIDARARLDYPIAAHGADALARHGIVQANLGDVVVPELQTRRVLDVAADPRSAPGVRQLASAYRAPVDLLDLVAIDRIVQEECEVRKKIQPRMDEVGIRPRGRGSIAFHPLR